MYPLHYYQKTSRMKMSRGKKQKAHTYMRGGCCACCSTYRLLLLGRMVLQIVKLIISLAINVFIWVFGMCVQVCVLRIRGTLSSPACQAVMQNRIVSLEDHHTIKPALREEITSMIIHDIASIFHHVFQLITYLQKEIISNKNVHIIEQYLKQYQFWTVKVPQIQLNLPVKTLRTKHSEKCFDMHLHLCIHE